MIVEQPVRGALVKGREFRAEFAIEVVRRSRPVGAGAASTSDRDSRRAGAPTRICL